MRRHRVGDERESRATDEELAAVRRVIGEMAALQAAGELLAMSEANGGLHQLILGASHHDTVQRRAAGLK
jgi:DNA-binding GntR family transcriptional regulator